MAGGSLEIVLLGTAVGLLALALVLMAVVAMQLRGMRREAEAVRGQLAKMDWSQMLLNGVQQLKEVAKALDTIDKRLQKLEAIEKVQLSHINVRAGR